jgi:ABC-type Zn uptake system ZnuABC Zn-binding protein ZnuA
MTLEDVTTALHGITMPTDQSAEIEKLRNSLSNSNSEAKAWKDKYRETQDEATRKAEETEENNKKLRQELETLKTTLEGTPCVLFHDSMAYLAADLGLDVKLTLSVEGESGLSAADLKKVEALAADNPDLLLFYDTQYALRYEGVGGTAVTIHTAVQEDWISAMEANIKELRKLEEVTP